MLCVCVVDCMCDVAGWVVLCQSISLNVSICVRGRWHFLIFDTLLNNSFKYWRETQLLASQLAHVFFVCCVKYIAI